MWYWQSASRQHYSQQDRCCTHLSRGPFTADKIKKCFQECDIDSLHLANVSQQDRCCTHLSRSPFTANKILKCFQGCDIDSLHLANITVSETGVVHTCQGVALQRQASENEVECSPSCHVASALSVLCLPPQLQQYVLPSPCGASPRPMGELCPQTGLGDLKTVRKHDLHLCTVSNERIRKHNLHFCIVCHKTTKNIICISAQYVTKQPKNVTITA